MIFSILKKRRVFQLGYPCPLHEEGHLCRGGDGHRDCAGLFRDIRALTQWPRDREGQEMQETEAWDGGWSKSCVEGTQTVPSHPCPQMPRPFTDPGEGEGGEGEGAAASPSAPKVPKAPD